MSDETSNFPWLYVHVYRKIVLCASDENHIENNPCALLLSSAIASENGCGIYYGAPQKRAGVIDNVGYVGTVCLNVGS